MADALRIGIAGLGTVGASLVALLQQRKNELAVTCGRAIEIVYTGLKPGEKLHEVLFASAEADERPFHSLVSHVDVPPTTKGITETIAAAPDALQAMSVACDALT